MPTSVFCKIENVIINGFIVDSLKSLFYVPQEIYGTKNIQISYDRNEWSDSIEVSIEKSENIPQRVKRIKTSRKIVNSAPKPEEFDWSLTRGKVLFVGSVVFLLMIIKDINKKRKGKIPNALLTFPKTKKRRIISPL